MYLGRIGLIVSVMIVFPAVGTDARGADFLGPTPYLSFEDSPFNGLSFGYFYLEDCEDGHFNTPGVSASGGFVDPPPRPTNDSVDGDDGEIDGFGRNGRGYYAAGRNRLTFTFNADVLGSLPTHVGVVWTDVGHTNGPFGYGTVIFEALDRNGDSLGTIGPEPVGDGRCEGQTAEDRFFGVIDGGGIWKITMRMPESGDWELDHLQYGLGEPFTTLPVDIKPGSCPNPLNRKSKGLLPVALLGTGDFDVLTVDPESVRLSRADGVGDPVIPHEGPAGLKPVIEDVGTPFDGEPCDCHEAEGDGIDDLLLKFSTPEVVEVLELDDLKSDTSVELIISGSLANGTRFTATDCVRLVPVKKGE